MMTVDCAAPRYVGWLAYLLDTTIVHAFEGYNSAAVNCENPTKSFLSAVSIAGLWSFIRLGDARRDMLVYRGEYVCDGSPGARRKAIA